MASELTDELRAALVFLSSRSDSLRRVAPKGQEDTYAAALWYPMAPSYSWPSEYGNFFPATLMAGVRRGFICRPELDRHAYRITPAGRAALGSGG